MSPKCKRGCVGSAAETLGQHAPPCRVLVRDGEAAEAQDRDALGAVAQVES